MISIALLYYRLDEGVNVLGRHHDARISHCLCLPLSPDAGVISRESSAKSLRSRKRDDG